ncbi:MAG: hypothetical protein MUF86_06940 [Akkermansiaceae bacterium]|jgi:hypothetical protein|nr:hypothetical protein [Akkermansiaceae bacterium]
MKTNHRAALSAAVIAIGALMPMLGSAQTNPSIPAGTLSAFPTVVQTGTKPTLTWSINYPSIVEDFITVTPPGIVTPKENLVCKIRMLGLGVTSQNSNGSITYYRTRARIRFNGSSSWSDIYDGKQTDKDVQQQKIVKTYNVNRNQPIYFGGQYYNNEWITFYSTLSGDNVRTLINGQTPPSNIPDYNAPSLEQFLKPYLDASGKVKIGPMDVIVFMELTHTASQKSNIGYDLQDCVMLVTFSKP